MRFNIYNGENKINTIIADEEFCKGYCKRNSYTYELIENLEPAHVEPETDPNSTAEESSACMMSEI